jgi:hypothetical protein
LRLDDRQRRRMAVKAKALGGKLFPRSPPLSRRRPCWLGIGKLIAQKYGGTAQRAPGRPGTTAEFEAFNADRARRERQVRLRPDGAFEYPGHLDTYGQLSPTHVKLQRRSWNKRCRKAGKKAFARETGQNRIGTACAREARLACNQSIYKGGNRVEGLVAGVGFEPTTFGL